MAATFRGKLERAIRFLKARGIEPGEVLKGMMQRRRQRLQQAWKERQQRIGRRGRIPGRGCTAGEGPGKGLGQGFERVTVGGAPGHQEFSLLAFVYNLYNSRLRRAGFIELDDLHAGAISLLLRSRAVRTRWRARTKHVLVDEFQDVNDVQLYLISLINCTRAITVCGDDDQSIYGFRGAVSFIVEGGMPEPKELNS